MTSQNGHIKTYHMTTTYQPTVSYWNYHLHIYTTIYLMNNIAILPEHIIYQTTNTQWFVNDKQLLNMTCNKVVVNARYVEDQSRWKIRQLWVMFIQIKQTTKEYRNTTIIYHLMMLLCTTCSFCS